MMASGPVVPVWAPVTAAAVTATALAVAVNYATGGGPWWLWVIVAVLTVAGVATSLWLHRRQTATLPPAGTVTASGERSVAVDGTVTGTIRTGDLGSPAIAPPATSPTVDGVTPAPGSVAASGPRSAALRGTAGEIVTGDEHAPPPSP